MMLAAFLRSLVEFKAFPSQLVTRWVLRQPLVSHALIENDYVTTTSYKAVKFENSCLSRNNIF